ncbi:hypothetical protein [Coralloluteibacterium thermophilus]|uniref:DUF3718 domain-containing protein n=1 Tax=Coralloluteibacterium thermophilum TaxID=2707049 RepID=A0ABV9NPH9_9GAMM
MNATIHTAFPHGFAPNEARHARLRPLRPGDRNRKKPHSHGNAMKKTQAAACLGALLALSSPDATSAEPLRAVIRQEVCADLSLELRGRSTPASLCVTQGFFSHDVYRLLVSRRQVLRGIDDEVAESVSGTYRRHQISLTCTPQLERPDEPPADRIAFARRALPDATEEEIRAAALTFSAVEVGRDCNVLVDEMPAANVQVVF